MGLPTIVQYWRSFEHSKRSPRTRTIRTSTSGASTGGESGESDRTGIWHETYLVQAGHYEAVYGNMPPHGLGKAGRLVPAHESSSARARLKGLGEPVS